MMTPDERPKPAFEPPPWEVEAFERFRSERDRPREAEELERALEAVRRQEDRPEPPRVEAASPPGPHVPDLPAETGPADGAAPVRAAVPQVPVIPEARIDAMLMELRAEEAPSAKAGPTLIYSAVAFMGTTGAFMMIAALVLFGKSRPAGGPGTVVAALASMVMLLTGVGCVAGAVVLYRKHHQ